MILGAAAATATPHRFPLKNRMLSRLQMAKSKTKKEKLIADWQQIEQVGFSVVRGTNGQLYAVSRTSAGASAVPFEHSQAMEEIYWLLMEADKTLTNAAIDEALAYEVRNCRNRKPVSVSIRVAKRDDKHYLDLCNPAGQVVEIDKGGWRVAKRCPVLFSRSQKALALPEPKKGGNLKDLQKLLLLDEPQWLLVLGWLLSALNEGVEPFALVLQGKPGAGKSMISQCLLSLIDPIQAGQTRLSYSSEDLLLTAAERRVLLLEEVPKLTADKVAAINGIVTGIAHSARKKYKDGQVFSVDVQRPVIINGNNNLLQDPALLDRSLPLIRRPLKAEQFRGSDEVLAELERNKPSFLGALLDLIVAGLNQLQPGYDASRRLRMAGATNWVGRCLTGSRINPNKFLDAVEEARNRINKPQIEEWVVYEPLCRIADKGFVGEMAELLAQLEQIAAERCGDPDWPKDVAVLGRLLNKHKTELATKGILFNSRIGTGGRRNCTIERPKKELQKATKTTIDGHTQQALQIAELAPDLLVYSTLNSGGVDLYGAFAEQASKLVMREATDNRSIRLTKQEWEEVEPVLSEKCKGFYIL